MLTSRPQGGVLTSCRWQRAKSAEHVSLWRHEQLSGAARSRRVRVPPYDGQGNFVGLAHNQLGRGGELVGDGQDARLHRVAVRVFRSPVVGDGVHTSYADGDVGYAVP